MPAEFRGFGHVQLSGASEEQVQEAVRLLHRSRWKGLSLRIQPARADHTTRLAARMQQQKKETVPVAMRSKSPARAGHHIPKHYLRVRPQPGSKVVRVAPPARIIGTEVLADPAFGGEDVKDAIAEQAKEAAACIGKSRSKRRQRMHPVHLIFAKRALIHGNSLTGKEEDSASDASTDEDGGTSVDDDGEQAGSLAGDSDRSGGSDEDEKLASEGGTDSDEEALAAEPDRPPSPQLLLHTGYVAGTAPAEWSSLPEVAVERIWARAEGGATACLSRGRRRGLARALASKLPTAQARRPAAPSAAGAPGAAGKAGAGQNGGGWLGRIQWDGVAQGLQAEPVREQPAVAAGAACYDDEGAGSDEEDDGRAGAFRGRGRWSKPGRSEAESDGDSEEREDGGRSRPNKGSHRLPRAKAAEANVRGSSDDDSDADSLGEFAVQQRKLAAQRLRDEAAGDAQGAVQGDSKLDMFAGEGQQDDAVAAADTDTAEQHQHSAEWDVDESFNRGRLDALRARAHHDERFRFDSRYLDSDEEEPDPRGGRRKRVPGPEGMTRGQHKLLEDDEFEAMAEDDGEQAAVGDSDAFAEAHPHAPTGAELDAEADRSLGLLDGVLGVVGLGIPQTQPDGAEQGGGGNVAGGGPAQMLSLASSVSRGPANAAEDEVAARRIVDRAAAQIDASEASQLDEAVVPELRSLRGSAAIIARIALRTRQHHATMARDAAKRQWGGPVQPPTDSAAAVAADGVPDDAVDEALSLADAARGFVPGGLFRFDPTKQACRVLLRDGGVKQPPKRLADDAAAVEKLQRVLEHQKPAEPPSGPRQVVITSTWRNFFGMAEADKRKDAAEPDARGLVNRQEWRESGQILRQAKGFALFSGANAPPATAPAAASATAADFAEPSAFDAAPGIGFVASDAVVGAAADASPFGSSDPALFALSAASASASPFAATEHSTSSQPMSSADMAGASPFGAMLAAPQAGSSNRLERVAASATRGQAFGGGDVDWDGKGDAEDQDSDQEDAWAVRRKPQRLQAGGKRKSLRSEDAAMASVEQPQSALDALSSLLTGGGSSTLLAASSFGSGRPLQRRAEEGGGEETVDAHSGYAAFGQPAGANKSQRRRAFQGMGRRARAAGKR